MLPPFRAHSFRACGIVRLRAPVKTLSNSAPNVTQLSTGLDIARCTGRSSSALASVAVGRDLVGPVEQLGIDTVAHNQPINTVPARARALVTSDAQNGELANDVAKDDGGASEPPLNPQRAHHLGAIAASTSLRFPVSAAFSNGSAGGVAGMGRCGPVPVIGGKSVSGPASTVIVAQGQSLVGVRRGVLYLALQGGSSQRHAHHRGCLIRSSGQRLRLPRRRAHRPPSQTLRCSVTPPPSTRCTLRPKSFYKRI